MSHNRMDSLRFIVSLLTFDDILGWYSSFWQINVTCRLDSWAMGSATSCPAKEEVAGSVGKWSGIAPFSLSTLMTTTTSFLPTLINFWILRIRRLDNSDSKIIPSMLSYSSYLMRNVVDDNPSGESQVEEDEQKWRKKRTWWSTSLRMSAGKVQNLTYKLNISSHLLNLLYLDLGRHWNHEGVRVSSQRAGKNGIPAGEGEWWM